MALTRAYREQHAHSGAKHVPFVVDFVRVKSYEGTETTGKGAYVILSMSLLSLLLHSSYASSLPLLLFDFGLSHTAHLLVVRPSSMFRAARHLQ